MALLKEWQRIFIVRRAINMALLKEFNPFAGASVSYKHRTPKGVQPICRGVREL
jgi:hypothetical protein